MTKFEIDTFDNDLSMLFDGCEDPLQPVVKDFFAAYRMSLQNPAFSGHLKP